MNRRQHPSVEAPDSHRILVIPVALRSCFSWLPLSWLLLLSGCVDVQGGAVELSWSLRTYEGASLAPCSRADIDRVRICWDSLEDGGRPAARCQPSQYRSFPCDEQSGVTRFEVPPGPASLFIEPVCLDGLPAPIGTYEVPPAIVRTIVDGEVATLSSLLMVVTDNQTCTGPGCTCRRAE